MKSTTNHVIAEMLLDLKSAKSLSTKVVHTGMVGFRLLKFLITCINLIIMLIQQF